MKKLVLGVGTNDADYPVIPMIKIDGIWKKSKERCPYYQVWRAMLTRCYSEKYQEKQPSYKGVTVCEDWLTFSNFRAWMITQDWEGKHLDKDLFQGETKVYCPENCLFVDRKINNLISLSTKGTLPYGVHYERRTKNPYRVQCWNGKGKQVKLGSFETPEEAHRVWIKSKISLAKEYLGEYPSPKLKNGLERLINHLEYHLNSGLEVTYL